MRLELKLKEVHLQNFRLFDDLKVSFDEQLTVFISENGAGKTSLLEGIARTLLGFTRTMIEGNRLEIIDPYKDLTENDVQQGKNSLTISNLISYKLDNILSNGSISRTKELGQPNSPPELRGLKSLINKSRHAHNKNLWKSLPIIMYYSSERANLTAGDTNARNVILNVYDNALTGGGLNFKQFLEWYVWQSQMAIFSKTPNLILQQVKLAILAMLNDDDKKLYTDVYIDPSQFKNPRLIVSKNDKNVEINQLSSGEKNLFVLVSDLARRLCLANPQSTNPLKEGQGIVLIDEIDLHLHPHWQRKILTQLKTIFPNIQWIVTTHSPFVLSAEEVHPQNAYLLTDEIKSDGTTQKIAVSIEDLGQFNQGLEPNRILSEIMRVPLRNQATETEIRQLHQLLNPQDFEKPAFEQLFQQLSHKLGIHDPVMVRANHRISVLKRQKQNEVH
jgi:predicted ATP-binding protein involved in virulence